MTPSAASPGRRDRAEAAWTDALAASAKAGVEVGQISGVAGLRQLGHLFSEIWTSGNREIVPPDLLTALAHSRQYLAGSWRDGELLGGSVAFTWGPEGGRRLHSHVTAVAPSAQNSGVGLALKLYQGAWAVSHGLSAITWTYDPLLRRNARFNLVKIGARVDSYRANFYGELDDAVNAGLPTDRLSVEWDLSHRVPGLSPRGRPLTERAIGLRVGPQGRPEVGELSVADQPSLACQIPADVLSLRRTEPELARDWQLALRSTMGAAIAAGFTVTSITPDGYYLLDRGDDRSAQPGL